MIILPLALTFGVWTLANREKRGSEGRARSTRATQPLRSERSRARPSKPRPSRKARRRKKTKEARRRKARRLIREVPAVRKAARKVLKKLSSDPLLEFLEGKTVPKPRKRKSKQAKPKGQIPGVRLKRRRRKKLKVVIKRAQIAPSVPKTPKGAAEALYKYVTRKETNPRRWGTKNAPNLFIGAMQNIMGELEPDGIYGPRTRRRGKQLIGRTFPVRRRKRR